MKKQNYVFNIPAQLKDDLSKINFGTAIRKSKALKFIHILRNKGFFDNYDMLKYQELSSAWFRDIFKGDYKKMFLNILVENKIIQVNGSYSEELGYSKSYRINEVYYNKVESYSDISYSDKSDHDDNICFYSHNPISFYNQYPSIYIYPTVATLLPCFSKKEKKQYLSSFKLSFPSIKKKVVLEMIDSLNVDYVSIINRTKEVIEEINPKKFTIDDAVEFTYFKVYNRISNNSYYTSKDNALSYCRKAGLTLIQDKDNLYIDDLDRYVETKKRNIYSSYTQKTSDLKKGIYYVDRNKTNNRLDTIFTSMCSDTFDIIKKDNGLIEIDLVNSQFAILSNWLMKEDHYQYEDVRLFCKLAIEGGLYEYLIDKLNPALDLGHLKQQLSEDDFKNEFKRLRGQAKKVMMMVCFSNYRFNSALKTKFKALFPNVNAFIHSFKKEADESKEFAINLQKIESKAFIDGLMRSLIEQGFFVLTKHDSLIIKREDRHEIYKFVVEYFKRTGLKASLKIEDEIIYNEVLDTQNQDKTIYVTDNTQREEESGSEDNNSFYAGIFRKIEKEYKSTLEISDKRMALSSIIALEHMSDRYTPAKKLLELIRA